ncbi:AAA family ATPase, partial [Streptomyces sp. NPDC047123]|uniref:ATP-binding protein n=1 Tax=Streptomyces sp. NPDC047123 TaxID=3155622 RepID=UPI0033E6F315
MVVGAPGTARRAPFVGRSGELGGLEALLTGMGRGTGAGVVDVVGEPGIGKSRLLTEFAARARARGVTVLRGRASERVSGRALGPFTDAFAELDPRARRAFPSLERLPAAVRGDAGLDARERLDGAGCPVGTDPAAGDGAAE